MTIAFVICKVLVREIEKTPMNYNLLIPNTPTCDTTLGNNDQVYVKYDDYSFIPMYVVLYENK